MGHEPLHTMCRCATCRRWQSTNLAQNVHCGGCGGALVAVDMAQHVDSVPKAEAELVPDPKK